MSTISFYKTIGMKLGIIASFLLASLLWAYAQNNEKADKSPTIPVAEAENQRLAASSVDYPSEDVKQIQTLLTLLDFNPGPIDGIFGPRTATAIRAFQGDIGVPVTGLINENLKFQLERALQPATARDRASPEIKPEIEPGTKPEIKPEVRPETKPAINTDQPEEGLQAPEPSESAVARPGAEVEMNLPETPGTVPQKQSGPIDRTPEPVNSYLTYIILGLSIVVLTLGAYFWTRLQSKKRERRETGIFAAENPEDQKPIEEPDMLGEIQEIEKEIVDKDTAEPESHMADRYEFQDPPHPGHITPIVRRKVWTRNKGQCAMCGSRRNLQYDYIIPISAGGSNMIENLQLLCRECAEARADKTD